MPTVGVLRLHNTASMELFSIGYITAIAAASGCDIQRSRTDDDSIDVYLSSRQPGRPRIDFQVKATTTIADTRSGAMSFPFRLKSKNYNDLRLMEADFMVPRLLIVLLMPERTVDWIEHGDRHALLRHNSYYLNLAGLPALSGNTHTVQVPWANGFTVESLRSLMNFVAVNKVLP